ncbi:MAG: sulfur carrier protein ThiS [Planctomycetota bacterium]|nr:sulfur carrier protein ThiS [Planctomycetota bacterium]
MSNSPAHPASESAATIVLHVNGAERSVPAGTSVRGLIELVGLGQAACAAEVNRELVPRRDHATRVLAAGDKVELVSLVGGG